MNHSAVIALALLLVASAAPAADLLMIPDELQVPAYHEGTGHTSDGAWTGTIFWRSPDCVPRNTDMLALHYELLDPEVSAQCPMIVEGFAIVDDGALFPRYVQMWNPERETIPIWFVSGPDILAARADGVLKFRDLQKAPSLRMGTADWYQVELIMTGSGQIRNTIATGWLDDEPNVTFTVHTVHNSWGQYKVNITFDENNN